MANGLQLAHRDMRALAARSGSILGRFDVQGRSFERRLERYAELCAEQGARPTLPITARVLERHPAMIRRFSRRGVEFAIHGLVHNDHAVLDHEVQRATIAHAARIFTAAGIPYVGFRGPYLRANKATARAVRSLGLRYDSSEAVLFQVLPEEATAPGHAAGFRRVLRMYRPVDADARPVRPRLEDGLVELPVALPDDEIMVERLGFDDDAQADAWLAILARTYAAGELFTLQLHPERAYECGAALSRVLAEARAFRPSVWIARLQEVADWWLARARRVVVVERTATSRFRVILRGDPRLRLVCDRLSGRLGDGGGLAPGSSVEVVSDRDPRVGVSPRTPERVVALLEDEGYVIARDPDPDRFGEHVDAPDGTDEPALLRRLERSPAPLLRCARWPAGVRSTLAVTGDIDSITLQDFALRLWETRG